MPKVSIVIPIYNVERYLRQCLDSVVNQTLKDIEIICVNDGSKDHSPDIINEYAAKDPRIKVINKENSGYGISMNMGFDMATGEYIGIVESDDYADPDMFEKLYAIAAENKLDAVKSSYYFYYSKPKTKNIKQNIASPVICNRTLCPRTSFKDPMEQVQFFNIKPTIWSAIYRRNFIRQNNIRFNETPGASYQDAGFNFKVWSCAERVQLVNDAYLHYRQDNENSSVNSVGKVFCICDEYEEMERFLNEHPVWKDILEPVKERIKYDSYQWNYERITQKYKYIFIERASSEFKDDMERGYIDRKYFENYKWDDLLELIEDPIEYHTFKMTNSTTAIDPNYKKIVGSDVYKLAKLLIFIPSKLVGGVQCIKDHGLFYTVFYGMKKLAGKSE